MKSRKAVVTQVDYLPFGPMARIQFGSGDTLHKHWDQNYWPQGIATSALDYQFQTDDLGNLTRISSAEEGTQNYAYDRLDRLSEVRDANQALIEAYTYDATGNRTSHTVQTASGPQTVNYGYPTSSHRLEAVNGQPRSFDAAGNTTSGIPGYQGAQAEYDVRNSLHEVIDPMGPARQRNDYNGRGERVLKSTGPAAPALPDPQGNGWVAGISAYVYDEAGQRLSRYDGHSEQYEDIVWIDNTPIARLLSSPAGIEAIHQIHSDHLNSPRALTHARAQQGQASGTTVWRWPLVASHPNPQAGQPASNAFGALSPEEDPDGNTTLVKFDLRFPGQQADAETGLYYNYFRDYEAGTGRYVESDPIGLRGGVGTFVYVGASPLTSSDRLGLMGRGSQRLNPNPYQFLPGVNTIGCTDTSPDLFVQQSYAIECKALYECAVAHEQYHLDHRDLTVCGGNAGGGSRTIQLSQTPDYFQEELEAYAVEIECLRKAASSFACDQNCAVLYLHKVNEFYSFILPCIARGEYPNCGD